MGIIEELQKANDTLKMQIKALSSDTQLPQNPVVEVVYVFYNSPKKRNLPRLWSLFTLGFRFICLSCAVYLHLSLGC